MNITKDLGVGEILERGYFRTRNEYLIQNPAVFQEVLSCMPTKELIT